MAIGLAAGLITAAAISAGAGVASSVVGSKAAKSAAKTQSEAAEEIRQQAIAAGEKATGEVKAATGEANQTLADTKAEQLKALAPYIQAGTVSLADIQKMLSEEGPLGTSAAFKFRPEDWQNDPGYDFQKKEGIKAIQQMAAAHGASWGGGTIRAVDQYTTGLADTHLDAALNRALQQYQVNRQNTVMRLQGLQGLTGLGYNATALQDADIENSGNRTAANQMFAGEYAGNTGLRASEIASNALSQKANAEAAGTVGSANAWQSGLGTVANAAQTAALMYKFPITSAPNPLIAPPRVLPPGYQENTGGLAYQP